MVVGHTLLVVLGGFRCFSVFLVVFGRYRTFSVVFGGYRWFSVVIGSYRWLSVVIGGYRLVLVVIGRYRWLGRGVRGAGHLPAITLSPILSLLMPCIIPKNFRSLRPILLEKHSPYPL